MCPVCSFEPVHLHPSCFGLTFRTCGVVIDVRIRYTEPLQDFIFIHRPYVSLWNRFSPSIKQIPRSFRSSSLLDFSLCTLISRTSSPISLRHLLYSLMRSWPLSMSSSRRLPFSLITVLRSRTSSATLRMYCSTAFKITLRGFNLLADTYEITIWSYESFLHRTNFRKSLISSNRCRHFFNFEFHLFFIMCWPMKLRPFNFLCKNFKIFRHSRNDSSKCWYVESLTSFSKCAFNRDLRSLHVSWKLWMICKMRYKFDLLWSDDSNRFISVSVSCKHAIKLAVTSRTVIKSIYRYQNSWGR